MAEANIRASLGGDDRTKVDNCLRVSLQDSILKRLTVRVLKHISAEEVEKMSFSLSNNIKELNKDIDGIVDAFGVPQHILEMIPAASD